MKDAAPERQTPEAGPGGTYAGEHSRGAPGAILDGAGNPPGGAACIASRARPLARARGGETFEGGAICARVCPPRAPGGLNEVQSSMALMGSSRVWQLALGLAVSRPACFPRARGGDGQAAVPHPGRHLGLDGPERRPRRHARRRLARASGLRPRRQRPLRRQQACSRPRPPCATPCSAFGAVEFSLARYQQAELGQSCTTDACSATQMGLGGQRLRRAGAAASPSASNSPDYNECRQRAAGASAARIPTTTRATSFTTARPAAWPASRPRGGSAWRRRAGALPRRRATNLRRAGQLDRRPGGLPRRHQPGAARPRAPRPSAASLNAVRDWLVNDGSTVGPRSRDRSTATTGPAAARTTSS